MPRTAGQGVRRGLLADSPDRVLGAPERSAVLVSPCKTRATLNPLLARCASLPGSKCSRVLGIVARCPRAHEATDALHLTPLLPVDWLPERVPRCSDCPMTSMKHPFADLIKLEAGEQRAGYSTMSLELAPEHMNPHGVVHGAVVFALADTGMGLALYPTLETGQTCATIDISISYFRPVQAGRLVCTTELVNRGRTVAHLSSRVRAGEQLVALATGNYAILAVPPRAG